MRSASRTSGDYYLIRGLFVSPGISNGTPPGPQSHLEPAPSPGIDLWEKVLDGRNEPAPARRPQAPAVPVGTNRPRSPARWGCAFSRPCAPKPPPPPAEWSSVFIKAEEKKCRSSREGCSSAFNYTQNHNVLLFAFFFFCTLVSCCCFSSSFPDAAVAVRQQLSNFPPFFSPRRCINVCASWRRSNVVPPAFFSTKPRDVLPLLLGQRSSLASPVPRPNLDRTHVFA